MKAKAVFIHLNTPSSKNSKIMVFKGEDEKPVLLNSKNVTKYIKESKLDWLEQKVPFKYLSKGLSLPIVIGVHFVRKSKHRYDWINMVQIVQDLMVKYGWVEDDDVEHLIPVPFKMKGSYSTYNKARPGVWIVPITNKMLEELNGNING